MPLASPALFVERLSSSTVLLSVGDSAIVPRSPRRPLPGFGVLLTLRVLVFPRARRGLLASAMYLFE